MPALQDEVGEHLLKTRFGSVDGGTCTLSAPHEGCIWDRLLNRGAVSVTAEVALTRSHVNVKRMFGSAYEIPLDQVISVHPCAAIGGRYWGRNSVLKVTWVQDGAYRCTWLMLGPGRNVAVEWAERIRTLQDPEFIRAHLESETQREGIERVRQRNRRLTQVGLAALLLAVMAIVLVIAVLVLVAGGD